VEPQTVLASTFKRRRRAHHGDADGAHDAAPR
jgi:hypothetical protein